MKLILSALALVLFWSPLLSYAAESIPPPNSAATPSDQPLSDGDKKKDTFISLWAGYSTYNMSEFNSKMVKEYNKQISGGINAGVEFSGLSFELPKLFGIGGSKVALPIGFEYLQANTETTHAGDGGSATVKWQLLVIGVYLSPQLNLGKSHIIFLRPLSVGYYSVGLGDLLPAELTVTDRAGRLKASAHAMSVTSQIGAAYQIESWEMFLRAGYRWLDFRNVHLTPEGGFTVSAAGGLAQAANLPERLDYSGLTIQFGLRWRFNAD